MTLGQSLRLAIRILPCPELQRVLADAEPRLEGDPFWSAVKALEQQANERTDAEDLAALERTLSHSPQPRLRRLGLATLVGLAERERGWDAARLASLKGYRSDLSPLVAAPAQFILPVEEESEAADALVLKL
jgi:hypothetical protein